MKKMLLGLVITMIAGCGHEPLQDTRATADAVSKQKPRIARPAESIDRAWESAGAVVGWYGPEGGFAEAREKLKVDSIPAYWAYENFKISELANLPVPDTRFGLHFGGFGITDSQLEQLGRFNKVEALGLNVTPITSSGLIHLVGFQELKILDLATTAVDDQGITTLSKLPNLKTLILSFTGVTDAGAETLGQMKSLERLDVCNTAVTDNGLNTLGSLPELKYLGVASTKATKDRITALKKLRPNLEVYDSHSSK